MEYKPVQLPNADTFATPDAYLHEVQKVLALVPENQRAEVAKEAFNTN